MGLGLSRTNVVESFILRAIESILSISTNQIMTHGCAVVEFVRRKFAVIRSCITSTCFSGNFRNYVFLNVIYFASGSTYFRAALALALPCRFCYSYLLFHALLTFYAVCSSPTEPPLKYHVENNSLSNSHFSLRGWFRRNMHETEASEVENGKKTMMRWKIRRFVKYFSFFSPAKRYVSSNCVSFYFIAWAFFDRYICRRV